MVAYAGEEFGGGAAGESPRYGRRPLGGGHGDGLEIVVADPKVTSVLVNVFGGITACDAVAKASCKPLRCSRRRGENVIDTPLVVRLDDNNAAEGRRILEEAEHDIVEMVDTMDGAARRATGARRSGGLKRWRFSSPDPSASLSGVSRRAAWESVGVAE